VKSENGEGEDGAKDRGKDGGKEGFIRRFSFLLFFINLSFSQFTSKTKAKSQSQNTKIKRKTKPDTSKNLTHHHILND